MSVVGKLVDLFNSNVGLTAKVTGGAWRSSLPALDASGTRLVKPFVSISEPTGGSLDLTTGTLGYLEKKVQISLWVNDPELSEQYAKLVTDVYDRVANVDAGGGATILCCLRDDEPAVMEDPDLTGVWQAVIQYTVQASVNVPTPQA